MKIEGFSQFQNLDPEDYYQSGEGYIIYTEKYHLKRGCCCKNRCKHCPYEFSSTNTKTPKTKNT